MTATATGRAMGSHQSHRAGTTTWGKATAVRFLHGRLHFHYPDGTRAPANSGAPSVLVAYGERAAEKLRLSALSGTYVGLTVTDKADQ